MVAESRRRRALEDPRASPRHLVRLEHPRRRGRPILPQARPATARNGRLRHPVPLVHRPQTPPDDIPQSALGDAKIIVSTNALTSDRSVPQGGRFATASFQVANLGSDADLNTLRVEIDGQLTAPCFVSRKTFSGEGQVNVSLPPGVRTGMLPAQLFLNGEPISNRVALRVTPAPVMIPRIASVTDGVNLLSDISIESRSLKVTLEEVDLSPQALLEAFAADLNGCPIDDVSVFQVDPLTRRYEVNLALPDNAPTGPANLNCRVGSRKLWPFGVNIAA